MDLDHTINFDHDEFSQIIPKEQFFEDLFPLYKNSKKEQEKILKQFLIDFPRQNMFIEENSINNLFQCLEYIYINMAHKNTNIFNEILQMSQQTPLSIPLKVILKKLKNMDKTNAYTITELKNAKKMSVMLNDNYIEICKQLRIFDMQKLKDISKINIKIIYNINDKTVIINYKLKNNANKYGFEIIDSI